MTGPAGQRDDPEEWFNGPGGDFWVDFKPMDPNTVRAPPRDARSPSLTRAR